MVFILSKEEEDPYPVFVADLLDYLLDCPLGDKSNSAAAITFLVNHPASTTFMDQIEQMHYTGQLVDMLTKFQKFEFDKSVGNYYPWGKRG